MDVWWALSAVYLVWGSTYLAIRFAVETLPPFLMAGSRFMVSGALLYLWMRYGAGEKAPKRVHWGPAAWTGFLLLTVGNGGVTWASAWVPSGVISLLVASVPLWTVLLIWGRPGGRPPALGAWIGLALGFTGVALLIHPGMDLDLGPKGVWASVLVVVTSLLWSYGALVTQRVSKPPSALLFISMQMMTGGVFQVLTGVLLGEPRGLDPSAVSPLSWGAWAYLTLIGSLVGFTCFIWVLQRSTAELASTYAFVNPVIALFLGRAFGGESLSPQVLLAAVLVVGAVVVLSLSPAKKV
jgi:drug/metabolite transporter (DMT)-like permease